MHCLHFRVPLWPARKFETGCVLLQLEQSLELVMDWAMFMVDLGWGGGGRRVDGRRGEGIR